MENMIFKNFLVLIFVINSLVNGDVRQNFHTDIEKGLNSQINTELKVFYIYEAMSAYFQSPNIGLQGFEMFFRECANEELKHAREMIEYMNKRGGKYIPKPILLSTLDAKSDWKNALEALDDSLIKEKEVNKDIIGLHNLAGTLSDPNIQNFLDDFLMEQVNSIASLQVLISRFKKMSSIELAQFLIDQELKESKGKLKT